MTNTEKFFVECVKKGIKNEKVNILPDDMDYTQFYNLCTVHSMSVVVFCALEKVTEKLPPLFLSRLQGLAYCHVARDVQNEYDIQTVITALEDRGLRHMPLKGYHLKKLYPSTDMRYASDCDILIDVDQLKEVRALVADLGLVIDHSDEHHDVVYHPTTKTVFEFHKTIFVGPLEKYFGVTNTFFDKCYVREGTRYFYEMERELFYVSILGHSAYHFAENAGVGIRHLTDIYLYRKAYEMNEEYLNAELEASGLLAFKNAFEAVAAYLFDGGQADGFTQKLAEHILESSLLSNAEKKSASDVAAQAKEENTFDIKEAKKRSFWRALFPIKEHMKFSYPVLKKHGYLLPLFYGVRWIHVVISRPKNIGKLKKMSAASSEEIGYMKEMRVRLGIDNL